MPDDTIYESHPGGGTGTGSTVGETGLHTPVTTSLDDKEYPEREAVQEEALENYHHSDPLPEESIIHAAPDGPFQGLVTSPDAHASEGMPVEPKAAYLHNPDLPVSRETEQRAAQAAADSELVADFEANGTGQPAQEAS
jgi:hypothetical protein